MNQNPPASIAAAPEQADAIWSAAPVEAVPATDLMYSVCARCASMTCSS